MNHLANLAILAVILTLSGFALNLGHADSKTCTQGHALSFGWNTNGQLGNGASGDRSSPFAVSGNLNISAIAAGGYHSLVLTEAKTVFAFGDNVFGQLGIGSDETSNTPLPVVTSGVLNGLSIKGIAAADYHSLLLSESGNVFSFGNNENGQLGDGTTTDRNVPVAVSTSGVLNTVKITAIAAGGWHSMVLSSSGTVYSFGFNNHGQLGDGTTTDRNVPVAVSTSGVLHSVKITAIAAGGSHSLVLSAPGNVYSFGSNNNGQLGDGTNSDRSSPVSVSTSGLLNGLVITAISAGNAHSLVLSASGKVFAFGWNFYGQLGDDTTTDRNVPVAVSTSGVLNGLTLTAIAAGSSHSLVLSESGNVFSFGWNGFGQLGDGTTSQRIAPVAISLVDIPGGLNISAISAGGYHSLVNSASCGSLPEASSGAQSSPLPESSPDMSGQHSDLPSEPNAHSSTFTSSEPISHSSTIVPSEPSAHSSAIVPSEPSAHSSAVASNDDSNLNAGARVSFNIGRLGAILMILIASVGLVSAM